MAYEDWATIGTIITIIAPQLIVICAGLGFLVGMKAGSKS